MSDSKGPITLITDLSERSNRWKALAFAWRSAAISSMRPCTACGSPSLWVIPETGVYWCQIHRDSAPQTVAAKAQKVSWFSGLQRALELEDQLEGTG
jgi:hypothetical protein